MLLSQLLFLRDSSLLRDPLSVLDVVGIYVNAGGDGAVFGNQQFFAWLRTICNLVYPKEANRRKAFHLMLTEVRHARFTRLLPPCADMTHYLKKHLLISLSSIPRPVLCYAMLCCAIVLHFVVHHSLSVAESVALYIQDRLC